MTREEALDKLKKPSYYSMNIEEEFEFIANKLDISVDELKGYHQMPLKSYKDYKNNLGCLTLSKIP